MPDAVALRRRVRVEMPFEDGFAVGGAGESGEKGVNTVGPVVSKVSVACVELLEKGVGWETVVAAAGASAEPVPTSVGTAKTEAKSVIGNRKNPPGTAIAGGDGGRNTSDGTPRRSRKVVNPHTWPVCAKIARFGGERESTQDSTFSAGH